MRIRVALAALPLLVLAACGSSTSTTPTSGALASGSAASGSVPSGADASASGSPTSTPPTLGPAVPAATAVAAAVPISQLPTASGGFGVKPALTFPSGSPVNTLQRRILVQGSGTTTAKGDFLVTNYLGQVWGGKVFDNSYDRKATSTFQIGAGKVVPGWDTALVGLKVGSRVLLSLPPADGYGSSGNSDAGIKGTDTLVFVIDIVSDINKAATGQTNVPVQKLPADVPQVTGALGKEPKIVIAKDLKEPTRDQAYVVAKGTGPVIKSGATVLVQYVVTDFQQTQTSSTWITAAAPASSAAGGASADASEKGLQSLTVPGQKLATLVGQTIGSRVLVVLAAATDASSGSATPTTLAVFDLVALG